MTLFLRCCVVIVRSIRGLLPQFRSLLLSLHLVAALFLPRIAPQIISPTLTSHHNIPILPSSSPPITPFKRVNQQQNPPKGEKQHMIHGTSEFVKARIPTTIRYHAPFLPQNLMSSPLKSCHSNAPYSSDLTHFARLSPTNQPRKTIQIGT